MADKDTYSEPPECLLQYVEQKGGCHEITLGWIELGCPHSRCFRTLSQVGFVKTHLFAHKAGSETMRMRLGLFATCFTRESAPHMHPLALH